MLIFLKPFSIDFLSIVFIIILGKNLSFLLFSFYLPRAPFSCLLNMKARSQLNLKLNLSIYNQQTWLLFVSFWSFWRPLKWWNDWYLLARNALYFEDCFARVFFVPAVATCLMLFLAGFCFLGSGLAHPLFSETASSSNWQSSLIIWGVARSQYPCKSSRVILITPQWNSQSLFASENLCHADDVTNLAVHCLWKVCLKLALPSLAEALQTVLVYWKDILEEVYA